MIKVYEVDNTDMLVVVRDEDPVNALRVYSLHELVGLRNRLDSYLATFTPDDRVEDGSALIDVEYISSRQACDIAEDKGIRLPITTVRTAMVDGHIAGVVKPKGRYRMPRYAFDRWLSAYESGGRRDDVRLAENGAVG